MTKWNEAHSLTGKSYSRIFDNSRFVIIRPSTDGLKWVLFDDEGEICRVLGSLEEAKQVAENVATEGALS